MPETFDMMVADYLRQILEVQNEGIFTIMAYCVGDLAAYKVVKLLEDMGHEVDRFIMLDEPVFIPANVLNFYKVKDQVMSLFSPFKKAFSLFTKKPITFWL